MSFGFSISVEAPRWSLCNIDSNVGKPSITFPCAVKKVDRNSRRCACPQWSESEASGRHDLRCEAVQLCSSTKMMWRARRELNPGPQPRTHGVSFRVASKVVKSPVLYLTKLRARAVAPTLPCITKTFQQGCLANRASQSCSTSWLFILPSDRSQNRRTRKTLKYSENYRQAWLD